MGFKNLDLALSSNQIFPKIDLGNENKTMNLSMFISIFLFVFCATAARADFLSSDVWSAKEIYLPGIGNKKIHVHKKNNQVTGLVEQTNLPFQGQIQAYGKDLCAKQFVPAQGSKKEFYYSSKKKTAFCHFTLKDKSSSSFVLMEFKSSEKNGIAQVKTYSIEIPSRSVASITSELKKKMQDEVR